MLRLTAPEVASKRRQLLRVRRHFFYHANVSLSAGGEVRQIIVDMCDQPSAAVLAVSVVHEVAERGVPLDGDLDHATPGLLQVWYSAPTAEVIKAAVLASGCRRVAFLSTPSIFFGLSAEERAAIGAALFEFDQRWSSEPGFVAYDCYKPLAVPSELLGQFDLLVADPPSMHEQVLRNYAATIKLLGAPGARVLFSTLEAFSSLMLDLLGVLPRPFRPMVNFVWAQAGLYALYTNFDAPALQCDNVEFARAEGGNADEGEPVEEYWRGFSQEQHEI